MRKDVFEALSPLCPRCLQAGTEAPVTINEIAEERAGRVWQGVLACSNSACWQEFPILDGVPIIVPDPATVLKNTHHQILNRTDLMGSLPSIIGDALGPGDLYDQTRQHLSIYAGSHFADWSEPHSDAGLAPVLQKALPLMSAPKEGPAIDLGCGVGRGTWALAQKTGAVTLGADLNLAMMRTAQTLALEGEVRWERRRIGVVYDPVVARLPDAFADASVDFWAVDAMALPFRSGQFGSCSAVNLVDCIPGPTNLIAEMARVLSEGAAALLTTPYDWSATVAEMAVWMGGHSQRGSTGGAGEPVLLETLRSFGLTPENELTGVIWRLALHARAVMHYDLHVVSCTRA